MDLDLRKPEDTVTALLLFLLKEMKSAKIDGPNATIETDDAIFNITISHKEKEEKSENN